MKGFQSVSQKILVGGHEAAEITIDWNPLFINVEEVNKQIKRYGTLLAHALADFMNKEEDRGES